MGDLITLLATPGVDPTLRDLANGSVPGASRTELEDVLHHHGASSPSSLLDNLMGENVLQYIGTGIGISRHGRKLQLLLEAIEGGDINDVYRRLRQIDGTQTYELIREGMTDSFFESLRGVRGRFGSLYVCSPWINASDRALRNLHFAVLEHQSRTSDLPELFVVTRPSNNRVEKDKLDPFRNLHAKIFYLRKLHSKLYIREPDKSGGTMLAIVGSQNLTRSRYLELGVQINGDDQLIRQLIRYFMDLTNISSETDSGQTSPKE